MRGRARQSRALVAPQPRRVISPKRACSRAQTISRASSRRKKSNEVGMTMIDKEPERHEIEELLPWYAAGMLSRHDLDRVERALAGDPELARRYDLVRQELAQTIHLNETLGVPSARAMEKLFAAINAEEGRCAAPPASAHQPNAVAGDGLQAKPGSIGL